MDMLGKHLKDLFYAINHCYQNQLLMPCLVLLYAGIDVAASLEPSAGIGVGDRFEKWVERYMLNSGALACTGKDLYAARCGVVHTFTPDSDISKTGRARVIGYAYGDAEVKKLDEATSLLGRQGLQVNVRLLDLIEAFHNGFEVYLKEAFMDSTRWTEVMGNAGVWTTVINTAEVDKFLAESPWAIPTNPE